MCIGFVKSFIHWLASLVGLEVHRRRLPEHVVGLTRTCRALRQFVPEDALIVDVGANHGEWTRIVRGFFPAARFVMVEPQVRLKSFSKDLLQDSRVRWIAAGASDQSGVLYLTVPEHDHSASFTPTSEEAASSGHVRIEVPVVTLDWIAEEESSVPSIVKIDAEGFDLRVLRGGMSLFGKTEVFLVECLVTAPGSRNPEGENTLQAVCAFMAEAGYRVFDITDLNRSPKHGVLWLCEVVFVRRDSAVWESIDSYS